MIIHLHNSWKIIAKGKGAWTSFIYTIILIHVKSNTPRYHLHRSFGNRRSFGGPMCNILGMSIPGTNGNSRDISLFSAEKWMCWKMCSDVLFCAEHLVLRYSKIHHQEMNRSKRSTLSSMKYTSFSPFSPQVFSVFRGASHSHLAE